MAQDLTQLSDAELVATLKALVLDERLDLVSVLRRLAEMDRRRLAGKLGFPSLFDYCVRELRYAEGEAARRIHAARAAARYPILYRAIGRGLLSLTTLSMLAPHLRWDNHRKLIRSALGRNKREVEKLVASLNPVPERPERVRFVVPAARANGPGTTVDPETAKQQATSGAAGGGPGRMLPPKVPESMGLLPLETPAPDQTAHAEPAASGAPRRVEFTFTADEELLESVERARGLLRHKYPNGGYEEVFAEAVRALLERIDPSRRAERKARSAPRSPAGTAKGGGLPALQGARRAISRRVREEVWRRDAGRCAFVGPDGRRCTATGGLEYDHIRPWAQGGRSDDPMNVRLLCRCHNSLEARRVFGDAFIDGAVALKRQRALGGCDGS